MFPAALGLPGTGARHNAVGCGKNGDAESSEDTWDFFTRDILAQTWLGHAVQIANDRSLVIGILEFQLEARVSEIGIHFVAPNVALFLEDAGDFGLHLREGRENLLMLGACPVADAREKI